MRNKIYKKWLSIILMTGVLCTACNSGTKEDTLSADQAYIFGQIESIYGNQMTLALATAEEIDMSKTGNRMRETNQSTPMDLKSTGETKEMLIPVGTVVTTSLGAETTFSRLAAGDQLKIKVETDKNGNQIILAIWIIG